MAAGEFRAKCLHLLDEVQQSRQEIVITRRGRPVSRHAPLDERIPALFGRMRGTIDILSDIVAPIAERWEAEGNE